jgi:hypothetical protein
VGLIASRTSPSDFTTPPAHSRRASPQEVVNPHPSAVTMKTSEERQKELKRFAAMPNGIDKLYAILAENMIPFDKLPIGTLMIETILDHEYGDRRNGS